MSFHQGRCLTGTPAFASINNHLGVMPGSRDDLESLVYMQIYFICGSLPWLTSDHEKLSSSSILARKVDTTIEVLYLGIPSKITTMLIYSHNLAFSEDPDYTYLQSLLHDVYATLPAPVTRSMDFSQSNDTIIHPPPSLQGHLVAKKAPSCQLKTTPLRRSAHHV